jgi:hypothetical protein
MSTYEKFYTESLYPLQDGIIKLIVSLDTPFYLTGGTLLGRGHFNHRYSDDLDYFVDNNASFGRLVIEVIDRIGEHHAITRDVNSFDYQQIHVIRENVRLKLDFVNDIACRNGDTVVHPVFGRTDNLYNVLTNKITALYRHEAKDIADLIVLCNNLAFNWSAALSDARQKEAGLEPGLASEIIRSIPDHELRQVKWVGEPDYDRMRADLDRIAMDILGGGENSLAR